MILKLGMKHQAMELYKVCINHDPGMTLTFFTASSTLAAHAFEREKNRKMSINSTKLARNEQMDRIFMFMNIFWAQRVVCPCTGAIYSCFLLSGKSFYCVGKLCLKGDVVLIKQTT